MNSKLAKIFAAVATSSLAFAASAAVPSSIDQTTPAMINYQGYLADPSTGNPYTDGIYTIECRLYRTATGGAAIWGGSYSCYVKGGHFNLMLGDSGATNLGYTYNNNTIWKALWRDSSLTRDEYSNLWLGVTVKNKPNGAVDNSATEISPRQRLLAAPFAFRSMAAYYAEKSYGDFAVGGNLSVNGSINFTGTYSFKHIQATASALTLGSGYSSGSNTLELKGKTVTGRSYGDINVATTAGNIKFTVPNGKAFDVENGAFKVNTTTNVTIWGGLVDISASTFGVRSTGSLTISATGQNSGALLKSQNGSAYVQAPTANVYLDPNATSGSVIGQGLVKWAVPGAIGYSSSAKPFEIILATVTIPAGSAYKTVSLPDSSPSGNWTYAVLNVTNTNHRKAVVTAAKDVSDWKLYVAPDSTQSKDDAYTVTILKINANFANYNTSVRL